MTVREKLEYDINQIQKNVEKYGADDLFNDGWERRLKYLQEKAGHYDNEVAAGYKHPTTIRWNNPENKFKKKI